MDEFTENIKKWVVLDQKINNIKEELHTKIKDYKQIKDSIENQITTYMQENKLTDSVIKISDSKIKYNETYTQLPITYKFLKKVFTELYDDDGDKAEEIVNYIKNRRETKKNINLKSN